MQLRNVEAIKFDIWNGVLIKDYTLPAGADTLGTKSDMHTWENTCVCVCVSHDNVITVILCSGGSNSMPGYTRVCLLHLCTRRAQGVSYCRTLSWTSLQLAFQSPPELLLILFIARIPNFSTNLYLQKWYAYYFLNHQITLKSWEYQLSFKKKERREVKVRHVCAGFNRIHQVNLVKRLL